VSTPSNIAVIDDPRLGTERQQLTQLSRLLLTISRGVNAFIIIVPHNSNDVGSILDYQLGHLTQLFDKYGSVTHDHSWFHQVVLVFQRVEDVAIVHRVQQSLKEQHLTLRENTSGADLSYVIIRDTSAMTLSEIKEEYSPLLDIIQRKERWTCSLLEQIALIDVNYATIRNDEIKDDSILISDIEALLLGILGTAVTQPLAYACCMQ